MGQPGNYTGNDPKEDKFVKGDVNGDGAINAADITALCSWILGMDSASVSEGADLNEDGKINIIDFCLLKEAVFK